MKLSLITPLLLWLGLAGPAAAVDDLEPELLEPDVAFAIDAGSRGDGTLQVTWKIADGYYMYRDRFRFTTDTPGIQLGEAVLPEGMPVDDEFFGRINIFRDTVTATVPINRSGQAPDRLRLTTVSQGCADIGVCYPPHTQVSEVVLSAVTSEPPAQAADNAERSVLSDTLESLTSLSGSLGLDSSGEEDFLDPDVAFRAGVVAERPDSLLLRWEIAEGYYLYRDKLSAEVLDNPDVRISGMVLPQGKLKYDEFFGETEVYYGAVEARATLQRSNAAAEEITVQLGYQGCADAGICYPPTKKQFTVMLAAADGPGGVTATAASAPTATPSTSSTQDDVVRVLQESDLAWVVLFFFGAGILLAFTACMYPMIPIISSIIVGHGENMNAAKAFSLTFVYVQAVAVTYAVIGVISAQIGAGVQAFFQNPWILGLFALIFVLLALSMFGFYSLQLPASWQARISETSNRQRGGSLLGVFVMGVLSALIVGPCAGPVLIGALIYTSQSADYLTGAVAMFALGNGLGAPLLVICTSGGKLLPRAGGWMDSVKAVFGVILLGVAVLMLERVLPGPVTMGLWALLLIVPAIYMGALDSLPADVPGWRRLWKGIGIAMLVYGIILIIGAATGARDPFNPLRNLNTGMIVGEDGGHASQHLAFERIKSIDDFNAALANSGAAGKLVMLDFYADWCTYCIKMEDYTFSDAAVQNALAGTTLLQADVTKNDATDLALLNHFGLFAPPAILFFGPEGVERRDSRLVGYMGAKDFLKHVEGALGD